MQIILASKSKRRKEILNQLGLDYKIMVPVEEEIYDSKLSPLENCIEISLQKAKEIEKRSDGDRLIIACDTIVVHDGKIYGKPHSFSKAFAMLKDLSGTKHEVFSCLSVIFIHGKMRKIYQKQGRAEVFIDKLTDLEITKWIETKKAYDKAGGYAIQEEFGKYISKIEGDYYSIVGLPLNELYRILKEINLETENLSA